MRERSWGTEIVAMSVCPVGAVAITALGEIRCSGQVHHHGDLLGPSPLRAAVGGIQLTDSGRGYWVWLADGSVYCFGDAPDPLDAVMSTDQGGNRV